MGNIPVKAIIFDCFGVIITEGLALVLQDLEKTYPESRHFIADIIKRNNIGELMPAESNRIIADRLGISVDEWVRRVGVGEVKNTELLAWIGELRQHYKTALLSNIGRDSLERRFTPDELNNLFDITVISADVGLLKPNPDIYKLTAEKLDLEPSDCVFLDDRQDHVAGARAAGMQAIWYQSFHQAKAELEKLL